MNTHTLRQQRLVDELVEAYVDWREACAQVGDWYRAWATGPGRSNGAAFGEYVLALDVEERAAEIYAEVVLSVSQLPEN